MQSPETPTRGRWGRRRTWLLAFVFFSDPYDPEGGRLRFDAKRRIIGSIGADRVDAGGTFPLPSEGDQFEMADPTLAF